MGGAAVGDDVENCLGMLPAEYERVKLGCKVVPDPDLGTDVVGALIGAPRPPAGYVPGPDLGTDVGDSWVDGEGAGRAEEWELLRCGDWFDHCL